MKRCIRCGENKDLEHFHKDCKQKSGISSACKECVNAANRSWYNANKENRKISKRKYYLKNSNKIKKSTKEYLYSRLESDELFRFTQNVSSLIRTSIKRSGNKKNSKTSKILCCSIEEFKEWLGGTNDYNNHIDHIIPSSWAETKEEVIALNHYSNFRLVPSKENIKKGNRYAHRENIRQVIDNHNNIDIIYNILIRNKNKLLW